jgi:MFS family permease
VIFNRAVLFSILMGLNLGVIFMTIPPALDPLMALYGVSYYRISLLISSLIWSHALMQVPAGVMTDRLGIRVTLIMCLFAMIIGHVLPVVRPDLFAAIVGRVIAGIGTGLSVAATMKLVALSVPENRIGTYQAFFGGFFSFGSILAYVCIPFLLSLGWQSVYIMPLVMCLPLLFMVGLLRIGPHRSTISVSLHLKTVLRMREGWTLGFFHALSFGSILTLGNWVPALLAEVSAETSAIHFAWGGAIIMLISGIGRVSGGFVLVRWQPLMVVRASILLLAVIFFGMLFVKSPMVVLFMALAAAWFASVNFGALFHVAARVTSSDYYATLFGFINFLANLGAVLFTIMFGFVKESSGSFIGGFGIMALLAAAAWWWGRSLGRTAVNSPAAS